MKFDAAFWVLKIHRQILWKDLLDHTENDLSTNVWQVDASSFIGSLYWVPITNFKVHSQFQIHRLIILKNNAKISSIWPCNLLSYIQYICRYHRHSISAHTEIPVEDISYIFRQRLQVYSKKVTRVYFFWKSLELNYGYLESGQNHHNVYFNISICTYYDVVQSHEAQSLSHRHQYFCNLSIKNKIVILLLSWLYCRA